MARHMVEREIDFDEICMRFNDLHLFVAIGDDEHFTVGALDLNARYADHPHEDKPQKSYHVYCGNWDFELFEDEEGKEKARFLDRIVDFRPQRSVSFSILAMFQLMRLKNMLG